MTPRAEVLKAPKFFRRYCNNLRASHADSYLGSQHVFLGPSKGNLSKYLKFHDAFLLAETFMEKPCKSAKLFKLLY